MINPHIPHEFINSNPKGFDSNCTVCEGKHRDAVHDPKYRKTHTNPREAALLASALKILKSDPRKDESYVNALTTGVDVTKTTWSNQGFDSQPVPTGDIFQGASTMAKANKVKNAFEQAAEQTSTPAPGTTVTHEDGSTETFNPAPVREKTKQEVKAEEAQAKIAAKAAKKAEAEAKKAAKLAEKEAREAARAGTAEERAKAKAERAERLAQLGKNYHGSMLALADRVKSGAYVKSSTGQLRSTNELATALDGVQPNGVIQLAKAVLKLESNPYSHLNVGQQSMNLRNKMRGAISKGELTMQEITDYIKANDLDSSERLIKERTEKAARIAAAKAEREAKKAEADAKKAAKPAESEVKE